MNFKLCQFTSAIFSGVTLSILFTFSCNIAYLKAQDDPDNPSAPKLLLHNIAARDNNITEAIAISNEENFENEGYLNNATFRILYRNKRQWGGCPNGCYAPCSNNGNCQQRYQLATVCVLGCCCPAPQIQTNLSCRNF